MKLQGKTALVTGAARGIGRGCRPRAGPGRGGRRRQRPRAHRGRPRPSSPRSEALGRQSALVEGDVFQRASCEQVVARAIEALGRIDILVSNPAFNRRADFLEYDPETFARVIHGTLTGGFHMSQLVARHMVERGGGGKIVFISSVHAEDALCPQRRVQRRQGRAEPHGLHHRRRAVSPPDQRQRDRAGLDRHPGRARVVRRARRSRRPARRCPGAGSGTPEDIGKAAVFLASDDADYITGTALAVDGGIWLRSAWE